MYLQYVSFLTSPKRTSKPEYWQFELKGCKSKKNKDNIFCR